MHTMPPYGSRTRESPEKSQQETRHDQRLDKMAQQKGPAQNALLLRRSFFYVIYGCSDLKMLEAFLHRPDR